MAQMSLQQLNDLLAKALHSLQDDELTIVTYDDPTKPLLPESYWRQTREDPAAVARTLVLDAQALRRRRREEDDALANASVDELIGDPPPLWKRLEHSTWGAMPMWGSHGTLKAPTEGDVQPVYNNLCQWCYRPITAQDALDTWKDHNRNPHCPDRPDGGGYGWHLPEGMEYVPDHDDDNDEEDDDD